MLLIICLFASHSNILLSIFTTISHSNNRNLPSLSLESRSTGVVPVGGWSNLLTCINAPNTSVTLDSKLEPLPPEPVLLIIYLFAIVFTLPFPSSTCGFGTGFRQRGPSMIYIHIHQIHLDYSSRLDRSLMDPIVALPEVLVLEFT